jgi:antitoxin ParD1/3/4
VTTGSFSPELRQLVQEELATGEYASEDELLLQAVRLLADRNRRRQELRRELQVARDQLDRGEGIELDSDEALAAFFDEIEAEVNAEPAAENGQ